MLLGYSTCVHAAHWLPGYKGDCARLHGHTYKIDVEVAGEVDSATGMIIDFKTIKRWIDSLKLDHQALNNILDVPTAENLATWIVVQLEKIIKAESAPVALKCVRVWETEHAYAEVQSS